MFGGHEHVPVHVYLRMASLKGLVAFDRLTPRMGLHRKQQPERTHLHRLRILARVACGFARGDVECNHSDPILFLLEPLLISLVLRVFQQPLEQEQVSPAVWSVRMIRHERHVFRRPRLPRSPRAFCCRFWRLLRNLGIRPFGFPDPSSKLSFWFSL